MFTLCNHVIFDINTLFKENHSVAIKTLDKVKLFKYTARGKNPFDLHGQLDELLVNIKGNGYKRPEMVEAWLRGSVTGAQTLSEIHSHIATLLAKKPHSTSLQLLKDVANIQFTPEILSTVLELNPKAVTLLKGLKKAGGYKLYLSGNLDNDTMNILKKKYGTIFSIFDDTIMSSTIHSIKPQKEFVKCLFDKWGISPYKACLIDDNLNDVKLLTSYGLNVFDVNTMQKNTGL